jgi:hypothetical protein
MTYPPFKSLNPPTRHDTLTLGNHSFSTGPSGIIGGTGPNNGWFALAGVTFSNFRIQINQFLYPGDPYYEAQTGGAFCTKQFLDSERSSAQSHELKHHQIAEEVWLGEGARIHEQSRVYQPTVSGSALDSILMQPGLAYHDAEQAAWDSLDSYKPWACSIKPPAS